MRDFIGSGIAETGPNKNVINIIRVLVEDKGSTVYIPYSYVKETSNKGPDPKVFFPPKESGRPAVITDVVGHLERFNFSVQCLVDVKVEMEDAEGKPHFADKKVWRNYSIIRDGDLVIDHIEAKLSETAFNELKDAKDILFLNTKPITEDYSIYDPTMVYTVCFKDLPLVSVNWSRPNALGFHKMLKESDSVSELLKQAKKVLKEIKVADFEKVESDVYTENVTRQPSVLLNKDVQCVTYTILPNPGQTNPKYEGTDAAKDVKVFTQTQKDLRFKIACIKWAIESAMTHRRSPYTWSEVYQKKTGSPKYYQEALVEICDQKHRLERCTFTKTI